MKEKERKIRHKRIRAKVKGTEEVPRLCVYRSNKHTYAQLIDDENGHTLVEADDMELDELEAEGDNRKVKLAYEVGKLIGEKAKEKGIKKVVFDRAGYRYHGRVKAVAEGAREELNF